MGNDSESTAALKIQQTKSTFPGAKTIGFENHKDIGRRLC